MQQLRSRGFALPTVLIASVVLLTVLAVSITATAAVRTTLKSQYYAQLAQVAGEAGVAYAKACLAQNENEPQWSDAKPLKPNTDCAGNEGSVQALVVAGGGGGGSRHGGGGGGGGLIYEPGVTITTSSYPVVVGGGGSGTPNGSGTSLNLATNGANSSVFGLTASGGGAGRGNTAGEPGGSGGGGGGVNAAGGNGTVGQGNNGGLGVYSTYYIGGGGGGAGGAGTNAAYPSNNEPAGGPGLSNAITGTSVMYAAGGKGGSYNLNTVAVAGAANTGNGGGGAGGETNGGGAGGSGVVIIAYRTDSGITATGGTKTTSGPNTIHRFTSSGTFTVTSTGTDCPSSPRCYVTQNGNVRSSFSVGLPTLDADGKAVTIPNTGYVEIIRSSTGAVWRTYTQPTVQAAVVPDLCSGQASSTLGWQSAFVATNNLSTSGIEGATPIALNSTNAVYPGPQYFRKDFSITQSGDYILDSVAGATQQVFIDGEQVVSSTTTRATKPVTLDVGCHTIEVRLYNGSFVPSGSELRTVLRREGTSAPIVKTDTTWRTAVGSLVEYTKPNYYQIPQWTTARDMVFYNESPWTGGPTSWLTYAADSSARWVNTNHNFSGTTYPSNQRTYFINNHLWEVDTATEFKFTLACDDDCTLYANGTPIIQTNTWNVTSTTTYVLQPGKYRLALELSNVSGASGFLFSGWRTTGGLVDESSMGGAWVAINDWYSSAQSLYSYAADFVPEPYLSGTATVDALVVAGGGGGGGNCTSCGGGGGGGGGGVLFEQGFPVTVGSIPVTVGAGGAGGPAGSNGMGNGGSNGENSSFGSLVAVGGGGGQAQNSYPGRPGGSGGGGSGGGAPAPGGAAVGVFGQGNVGGSGVVSPYGGGGGGGAGARGNNATTGGASGSGGIGRSVTLAGMSAYYGGGGGGGAYTTYTAGAGGAGGGGNGVNQNANNGYGYAGQANTGGGGGGSNGNPRGGGGGSGGSGIVIIGYPTGSLTATGGTVITLGGFTIHQFTSDGTFRITSIN